LAYSIWAKVLKHVQHKKHPCRHQDGKHSAVEGNFGR